MQNPLNVKLNKKGFTLIELLVAMAIIAVLIAIAAFGIQILQRNSRNTQRRKILSDIQLIATDIATNYQTNVTAIACDTRTITVTAGTFTETYTLPGRFTCATAAGGFSTAICNTAATMTAAQDPAPNDFTILLGDTSGGFICTVLEDNTGSSSPIFRVRID